MMIYQRHSKMLLSLMALITFGLLGCQKGDSMKLGPQNLFQSSANKVLSDMARKVDLAKRGITSSSRSSYRGAAWSNSGGSSSGGWSSAGPSYSSFGGSSYPEFYDGLSGMYQPDVSGDTQECVARVQMIPKSIETYGMMVALMTQCLDRLLVYRNPIMTFAYRNFDPQTAAYFAYLLNWRGDSGMSGASGMGGYGADIFSGLYMGNQNPAMAGMYGGFGS